MKNTRRRGIVLMEILIALAVMGVGILALMQAISFLARQDENVRTHAYAVLLAENILSRRLAGELTESQGEEAGGEKTFSWQVAVENASEGLSLTNITVSWQEKRQQRKYVAAGCVALNSL